MLMWVAVIVGTDQPAVEECGGVTHAAETLRARGTKNNQTLTKCVVCSAVKELLQVSVKAVK